VMRGGDGGVMVGRVCVYVCARVCCLRSESESESV